ncbi:glycerophosphodiester phosphodiesterase family protein [Algiphilus aromaticivorans]|uniref:glycerophosphodiester phosphodiesterase family protein n=1 Tax=Algiphilus aromaticivorans TaxID=382454 RepID=UPI00069490F0|nr:glycerophosphodiester phosphodiesterase family protein [Algiphilus aromaticivorans]
MVHDVAAPEGAAGEQRSLRFVASLSEAAETPVRIRWSTADGDAVAGEHFIADSGKAVIAAGERHTEIPVTLIGNDAEEAARRFRLRLDAVEGARAFRSEAVGTIANDDTNCLGEVPTGDNPWLARSPISFAHRGGVREFPENTLYAYHQAAAAGSDVLEMDVYQTADDELVVLHDLTVDRTTDGSGDVGDFTLAELKAMDAAYWFVPGEGTTRDADAADYVYRGIATGDKPPPPGFTANDFRIPTLDEALARFPDELINVELKPDTDDTGSYEGNVARLLRDFGRFDDVMVASFVDTAAALFKLQGACISTSVPLVEAAAVTLASKGPLPMAPVPGHQAFQVPMDTSSVSQIPDALQIEVVTQDFIDDAHAVGLAVHVWTIDDCPTMVELLEMGVDGIMTDRPLRLQQVLDQPEGEWSCDGVE